MLSILIVDDTPEKEQTLRKFILDNFEEVKNSDIEWAECTNDAFRKLSRKYYDLVMLDLFIKQSKRKDAKADPENAVNFIELLNEYGDTIKQPAHILGITHTEEDRDIIFIDKLPSRGSIGCNILKTRH